ncbi:MAG: hypothetical protein H3C38_10930 [Rhodospirillales bacterium]|nr:hypothetical protein [Rhodospirillales bacterium]
MAWLLASPVTAGAFELCFGGADHIGIEALHEPHAAAVPEAASVSNPELCSDVDLIQQSGPQSHPVYLPSRAATAVLIEWPETIESAGVPSARTHSGRSPPTALLVRASTILLI